MRPRNILSLLDNVINIFVLLFLKSSNKIYDFFRRKTFSSKAKINSLMAVLVPALVAG